MKPGKKLLIVAVVALAAGAVIIAVWFYSPPRESPAQRRARELVAELRYEPPGRLEKWLISLGLRQPPDPPRYPGIIIGELASLGEDAVPVLIEAFEDGENSTTFWAAWEAVLRIGPSAVPHLIPALKDERASVRGGAILVLGQFGPAAREAIPALQKIVRREQDSRIRKGAEMALKKIDPGPIPPPEVHHVVYVIDRSGSMMDRLSGVKREVALSIGQLTEFQDLHVVVYGMSAEGGPAEGLVPATDENKLKAVGFLRDIRARGQADPVPALEKAFGVLAQADPKRPGKAIRLLTDGMFPDNKGVLEVIRGLNKDKDVRINTYLLGRRHPVAVSVLKTIASENGGHFKHIEDEYLE